MLLFKKATSLQCLLNHLRAEGNTIGFVPTMGALHEGHISLIRAAQHDNDYVVCSIFVNPTQFNDPTDLEKYPRNTAADIGILADSDCQILFLPPVDEIYPGTQNSPETHFDFGYLGQPMEGAHRPGHFTGVAMVVHRLLQIVKPHKLYMGQKDFQQFIIIRKLLEITHSRTRLVCCPIVREPDGLAMSSRNVLLNKQQRAQAPLVFQTLCAAKAMTRNSTPGQIIDMAMQELHKPGMVPEYFEIVDGHSLLPLQTFENSDFVVACTAVRIGDVRIIDNMILKKASNMPSL
ncbi:MAG: pantoate--beta-alanine ligase [Saprospiraceae bacterium]